MSSSLIKPAYNVKYKMSQNKENVTLA